MQLSKNFTLQELLRSETAIRKGYKEQYTPPQIVIDNLKLLCEHVLQPLRDYLGVPIRVTCGYRCPRVNKSVGGSATSEHKLGMAADLELWIEGKECNQQLFDAIVALNLPFSQLIDEYGTETAPAWIHVSYNKNKIKRQKLRATKLVGGDTLYTNL